MSNTPASRFQTGDDICGFVDAFYTCGGAIRSGRRHEERHEHDGDPIVVTVYDVMARHHDPETWTTDGRAIAFRL